MITFLNNGKGGTDTSDATATENDILNPKVAYAKGERIIGVMPNNGSLEYIPSENEQSIPLGYTSGGIIKPADITKLKDYEKCYNLAQTILSNVTIPIKGLVYNFMEPNLMFNNTTIDTKVAQASLTSGYTFIARIYPTQYNNHRGLFGLHENGGIVGLQYENGKLSYGHVNTGIVGYVNTSDLPLYNWGIFVVTYNGSNLKCYVNKKEIFSVDGNDFIPFGNVIIGKAYDAQDRYYAGCVSNFMIYNRSLTEEELEKVYNFLEVSNSKSEYTNLEYIESTGTQYIDTGIIPSNHKIEIKFRYIENQSNAAIFGTKENIFHLTWFSNTWYYACGAGDKSLPSPPTQCTDIQTVIFNNENNKIEFDGVEYGTTATSVNNGNQTLNLWRRPVGTATPALARIYYCRIWDKNTEKLIRDFIPVRDELNNIGLYDTVDNKFYMNNGTGTFKAGSNKEV